MRGLSLTTLLMLRRAALALVAALEAAALEAYGWTPRGSTAHVDPDAYNEVSTTVRDGARA